MSVKVCFARQACKTAVSGVYLSLCFPPPEVSLLEVLHIGRMDGPVVALPVGTPPSLHEAVIEGEVVSY